MLAYRNRQPPDNLIQPLRIFDILGKIERHPPQSPIAVLDQHRFHKFVFVGKHPVERFQIRIQMLRDRPLRQPLVAASGIEMNACGNKLRTGYTVHYLHLICLYCCHRTNIQDPNETKIF